MRKLFLSLFVGIILPNTPLTDFRADAHDASNNSHTQNSQIVSPLIISENELYDRIYASWLGQLAGNIYGLPHENIHIDNPGPNNFPYGYDFLDIPYYKSHFGTTKMTGVMKAYGGAFSDDDTDIEYVYLNLMEEVGIEPNYGQIRNAWINHIDDWTWLANRQAAALMHMGYEPPFTGSKNLNPDWFQIDPQLINEIWAITAPGMVNYATEKSRWAAKISADGEGIEPTIAYGAMFSAAFKESDVKKLVDIGQNALPTDAKFAKTIAFVKELKQKYPDDWQAARKEIAQRYYKEDDKNSIWSANLNGACAILALLYGNGDFQKTMDLATAIGFDADNQAATIGGLLGLANGTKSIPDSFLYPIKGWELPFNDRYLNRTRKDLPSTSITDMAKRTTEIAKKVIIEKGGNRFSKNGTTFYEINSSANFTEPFELSKLPPQTLYIGRPTKLQLYSGGIKPKWSATNLPEGLGITQSGEIVGSPNKYGKYEANISAQSASESISQKISFLVVGKNLAPQANEIIGNAKADNLEILRDGITYGGKDISTPQSETKLENFGYKWAKPISASNIIITMGKMGEYGGWFTSLGAEYLNSKNEWVAIPKISITPEPQLWNNKHLQPHYTQYRITFPTITTKGIRINGLNGGEENKRFITLSELEIFE